MAKTKAVRPERDNPELVSLECDVPDQVLRRLKAAAMRYDLSMGEVLEIVILQVLGPDGRYATRETVAENLRAFAVSLRNLRKAGLK
jgi:hypothetical protein